MLLKWFSDNLALCIVTMFHKRKASFGHPAGMYVCMCICLSNCFMPNVVAIYEGNALSNSVNNIVFFISLKKMMDSISQTILC
jgi:hypothetical protein